MLNKNFVKGCYALCIAYAGGFFEPPAFGACISACGILGRMTGALGVSLVLGSAILVAVADSLIKRLGDSAGFMAVALNPWMLAVCALYLIQILFAVYIFTHKGGLALYGNMFNVFYTILMTSFGVFFFSEQLSGVQLLGIVLALLGIVLINFGV
jgi:drug/metabolite transporter (DMT)-like permease